MNRIPRQYPFIIAATLALSVALAGCATPTTRPAAEEEVSAAQTTLNNFRNDPNMTWFRSNLKNAHAVIISPRVTRGALLVGGSGGEAVVLASEGKGGLWVGPAFYKLGDASLGLQAGVDVSEVVILVMTEKARDALLSSSFKLGGDASIAAGPVGIGASTSVTTDLVAFARSKGVYAGLSLESAVIRPDTKANAAFYGREMSPLDILVRGAANNPAATSLQQSLRADAR